MMNPNQIARIGSLIGDPARAAMLMTLMNGRSLTANELARCAGITPQTASSHLSKLVSAGLLQVNRQGRHRYHRIATRETAGLIESIMQIASADISRTRAVVTGPRDKAMRKARTCYDHLAGSLGVAVADSLLKANFIVFENEAGSVTRQGVLHLKKHGIDLKADQGTHTRTRRPMCRPCLDWSVRRPHVAGTAGAAICKHFIDNHFVVHQEGSRALTITSKGEQALFEIFGIQNLE